MPLASITRQLIDRKLEPLRYKILNEYMVNEFSDLPLDRVFKSDYLLQLGNENALAEDKNNFKTICNLLILLTNSFLVKLEFKSTSV